MEFPVRECDALLLLISRSFLASQACLLERQYATLGKHLVPVMVAPVPHHILPSELAPLQIVNYVQAGEAAAYALAKAAATIPTARQLPHPLPPAPPVPLSYLNSEERRAARELLEMFCRRTDPYESASWRDTARRQGTRLDRRDLRRPRRPDLAAATR